MSDRYVRRLRLALKALEDTGDRPLSYAELGALGVEGNEFEFGLELI